MSDDLHAPSSASAVPYAFLSYSRKDATLVGQLASYLRQEEIPPWRDNQLDFGNRWEDVIAQRIRDCKVFMVAMSEESRESQFVQQEIQLAMDERKPIIPILLGGEPFEELTVYQYVPLREIERTQFVESLRNFLTPSQVPSVHVQHRRIRHLVLSVFEEVFPKKSTTGGVPILLGFGFDRYFSFKQNDSLEGLDDLDWLEVFIVLRERLPGRDFGFTPDADEVNYSGRLFTRFPTIQAFIDFMNETLTWRMCGSSRVRSHLGRLMRAGSLYAWTARAT